VNKQIYGFRFRSQRSTHELEKVKERLKKVALEIRETIERKNTAEKDMTDGNETRVRVCYTARLHLYICLFVHTPGPPQRSVPRGSLVHAYLHTQAIKNGIKLPTSRVTESPKNM